MQKQVPFARKVVLLLALLLIAGASRLPLLGDDRAILDGDEALMGLMSLYQVEKGVVPVFFWGQNYGFSFAEVSSISLFTGFLGYGDLAVKAGMLFLFLLTLWGMFLFFEQRYNTTWAFWIVLLFALHPAWYYWSLKARGGYMTALLCSSWMFYAVQKNSLRPWLEALLAGLLLVLVYHSQKLWFPSSLLLLCALYLEKRPPRSYFGWLGGFLALFSVLMYLLVMQAVDFWRPVLVNLDLWKDNILLIPERIQQMFEGNYFLGEAHLVGNWTYNSYSLMRALFFFSLALWLLKWKGSGNKMAQLFIALAMLAPFGVLFIAEFNFGPRYLLAAPFFILLWASDQLYSFRYRRLVYTFFVIASVIFCAGSLQLKNTWFYQKLARERREIIEISDLLVRDNYRYVLAESPGQPWQIMFYTKERVISSSKLHVDRRQDYVDSVRAAYYRGEPVPALAFHPFENKGMKEAFEPYGSHFILRKPTPAQLDSMGFIKIYPH